MSTEPLQPLVGSWDIEIKRTPGPHSEEEDQEVKDFVTNLAEGMNDPDDQADIPESVVSVKVRKVQ